ncbi:hypothetical protein LTR22_004139 [Elasticomyces elasticus]|nr:hypothetical protein LTR22_004139 [Elasticomyces elasticus]KAK5766701.1 hypothetical protein LTS12_003050 [Elasticomyces elasticus]
MAELLELKNAASATAAYGGHNSSTNSRSKSGTKCKTNAKDTIDASSPPKKSSRLGDNFTPGKSADPDDEEMSIGGLREEDVASEDGVSEAVLAGEHFAQDKSADPDDEEMSISSWKEEDVASEDEITEDALAAH